MTKALSPCDFWRKDAFQDDLDTAVNAVLD